VNAVEDLSFLGGQLLELTLEQEFELQRLQRVVETASDKMELRRMIAEVQRQIRIKADVFAHGLSQLNLRGLEAQARLCAEAHDREILEEEDSIEALREMLMGAIRIQFLLTNQLRKGDIRW
jgi:hypothetical protein